MNSVVIVPISGKVDGPVGTGMMYSQMSMNVEVSLFIVMVGKRESGEAMNVDGDSV
jgi:hypothetical protein